MCHKTKWPVTFSRKLAALLRTPEREKQAITREVPKIPRKEPFSFCTLPKREMGNYETF